MGANYLGRISASQVFPRRQDKKSALKSERASYPRWAMIVGLDPLGG